MVAVGGADHCVANVSVPRTASSPPTRASTRPFPTGPRTASTSQLELQLVARLDDALEAHVVDAGESASFPRFSSSDSTATAPAWASASTMITPGMIGRSGKCPGKNHSSGADLLARDDAAARLELGDLVEEEEGIAVRDDRLDHVTPEGRSQRGRAGLHVRSVLRPDARPAPRSARGRRQDRHEDVTDTSHNSRYRQNRGNGAEGPWGTELCGRHGGARAEPRRCKPAVCVTVASVSIAVTSTW